MGPWGLAPTMTEGSDSSNSVLLETRQSAPQAVKGWEASSERPSPWVSLLRATPGPPYQLPLWAVMLLLLLTTIEVLLTEHLGLASLAPHSNPGR